MSATAANLIERVLPPSTALRQWVLTFPFSWRPRLAQDGELLGRLTQIFVDTVQAFYVRRAARAGAMGAKTGAVTAGGHGFNLPPGRYQISVFSSSIAGATRMPSRVT